MKNSLSIISIILLSVVCGNVESTPHYVNNVNMIEVNTDMSRGIFYKYIKDNRECNKNIGDKYYSDLGYDEACKNFAKHYPIVNNLTNAEDIGKKYNNDNAIINLCNCLLKEYAIFFNHHSRTKNLKFFYVFIKAWNDIFNIVQKDKKHYSDNLRWKMIKISNFFEYFNPIGFNVNIDMSPKELIEYAYNNRDYNILIGDTRPILVPINYPVLNNLIRKEQFNKTEINSFLQETLRFFNHHSTTQNWEIAGYVEQIWWNIWKFLYNNILNIKSNNKALLENNIKLIKKVKGLFINVLTKLNCTTFTKDVLEQYKILKKNVIDIK